MSLIFKPVYRRGGAIVKLDYPSHVEIDLDRLHANIDLISRKAGTPLAPVIKADAYGHGAVAIARQLSVRSEVEAFCVWTLREAVRLRKHGIKGRIIVLGGVFLEEAGEAVNLDLEVVISSLTEAKALAGKAGRRMATAHLKINTGMTRLGAGPEDVLTILRSVSRMKKISLAGVMTHLADSDKPRSKMTKAQLMLFDDILSSAASAGITIPPRHTANTGAIFLHPASRHELARPGIGVYGVQEFGGKDAGLKPILSLRAKVALVREVKKGEPVSYGMTWISPGRRKVAVARVGYADGYSRGLSNKAHAIIGGKKIRQIGIICMDNCLFDVTGLKVKVGDTVTLIGSDGRQTMPMKKLARALDTISYEIMCGISWRLPRVYLQGGKVSRSSTGAAR